MGAPVIGLTTYREQAAWGVWDQRADVLPTQYAAAVEATGGVPVLLPPLGQEGAADSRRGPAGRAGHQRRRRRRPGPLRRRARTRAPQTGARTATRWEMALLDAADAAGLPVLGVCRGMQVMAVQRRWRPRPAHARPGRPRRPQPRRGRVRRGSRCTRVAGHPGGGSGGRHGWPSTATTTSPCARTRASWRPRAPPTARWRRWRRPGDRFCVAVQWHPETAADVGLLAGLVRAAAERAAKPEA